MERTMKFISALLLFVVSAAARAELTLYAGVEYFYWKEYTTPSVQETGPLVLGGLVWLQDRERGLLFGYRGQIYTGQVDYDGAELFTGAPLTGTVQYFGVLNEGQLRYRFPVGSNEHLDGVLAAGADIWRRQFSADQMEDWAVGYARLGVELGPQAGKAGWIGTVGVKYPFYTYEDGHLNDTGFDQNPTLRPGGSWSAYASLGYRIGAHWSVAGFYDSYRFQQSPPVQATLGGTLYYIYQPKSSMNVYGVTAAYTF
jgi:hypothetical protein